MAGSSGIAAAQSGGDLELCARADRTDPNRARDNSKLTLRVACKPGKEVSIGTVADLSAITTIRTITSVMSFEDLDGKAANGKETLRFTGVNLQVVSGEGDTSDNTDPAFGGDGTGEISCLGNLIVGYNEDSAGTSIPRSGSAAAGLRTGSHNLIVGPWHSYSSYGGFLAGRQNTVSAASASAGGGEGNSAGAVAAAVTGGLNNTASGDYASINGGISGFATGLASSVNGGTTNHASGQGSSVGGGRLNVASGDDASVAGGEDNTASGYASSVTGGERNEASGLHASVGGGSRNLAAAETSAVNGGVLNSATGAAGTVNGGDGNEAKGTFSAVSGGSINMAAGGSSTVGGGQSRTAASLNNWTAGALNQTD